MANSRSMLPILTDNESTLQHAADIQAETLSCLERTRLQAAETEDMGNMTLEQLRKQREKMGDIVKGTHRLNDQLDHTEKLQNRFSKWAVSNGSYSVLDDGRNVIHRFYILFSLIQLLRFSLLVVFLRSSVSITKALAARTQLLIWKPRLREMK